MLLLCARFALADETPETTAPVKGPHQWDDKVADISASALIPAPPATVFNYMLDLSHWSTIYGKECIGSMELGDRTFGEGANAMVRYDMGMMHRKLPMTLTHANAPTSIDFDHLGKLGFITRWTLVESGGGTQVTILSPLNPPPKPLRGYYFTVVQPEWKACYETALVNLAKVLAG